MLQKDILINALLLLISAEHEPTCQPERKKLRIKLKFSTHFIHVLDVIYSRYVFTFFLYFTISIRCEEKLTGQILI